MAIEKKNILSPFKALKNLVQKPVTVRYPKEELNVFPKPGVSPNYRGLHTNDLQKCIGCGTCADICPTDAIRMVEYDAQPKEGQLPRKPVIDYGRCCFCGYCVDVCTTGSLEMSRDFIHLVPTPDVKDPDEEVELIKDSFIIKPTDEHSDNIGYFTPTEESFLDLEREKMGEIAPEERKNSFVEFVKGYTDEEAMEEAARCVECGICVQTCPVHMDIPQYIHAIWEGDNEKSVDWIYNTNALPSVCGRVCIHPCEEVCSIQVKGEPVAIRWLKRYAMDHVPEKEIEKIALKNKQKGKLEKIAIIGGGPAGLQAGYYLALKGYEPVIYEKNKEPGGMMRYAIPEYRMPKAKLAEEIGIIKKAGVKIKTNKEFGKDITMKDLEKEGYAAIFVAIGAQKDMKMGVPGEEAKHCLQSIEFLKDVLDGKPPELGKKVAVVGGGNSAMDVSRTLIRMGKEVHIIYRRNKEAMPADPEEIREAEEEGVIFHFLTNPVEIIKDKDNKIESVKLIKMKLGEPDASGRRRPIPIEGSEYTFKVDALVTAIGQLIDTDVIKKINDQIELSKRNRVVVKDPDTQRTNVDGIWSGGDCVMGPSSVIQSMANGRRAAEDIDKYLIKKRKK